VLSLILFDSKVPHYSTKVLCHYDPREPASITTDAGTSLRVRIQSSPYPSRTPSPQLLTMTCVRRKLSTSLATRPLLLP